MLMLLFYFAQANRITQNAHVISILQNNIANYIFLSPFDTLHKAWSSNCGGKILSRIVDD